MLTGREYTQEEGLSARLFAITLSMMGKGSPKAVELAERIGPTTALCKFAIVQAGLPAGIARSDPDGGFSAGKLDEAAITVGDDEAKRG